MCKICTSSLVFGAILLALLALPSFAPAGGCGGCSGSISHAHSEAMPGHGVGICPVSGKPGSAQHSLSVGSKTYYFCSSAHMKEFRARPLHYLKIMHRNKRSMKAAVCPVTGKSGKTSKCSSLVKGKCCGTCENAKMSKSCATCPHSGKKAKCCGTCDNAKMSKTCPAMKGKGCGTAMSKSCSTCPHSGKKAKCCGTCQKTSKKGCSTSSCSDFKKRYFYH